MADVYIVCAAHYVTGGIELCHQLARVCLDLKYDIRIVYTNVEPGKHPVNESLKGYDIPWTTILPSEGSPLVIVPEIFTFLCFDYPNCRFVIWWMSIDNYLLSIGAPSFGTKNDGTLINKMKYLFRLPLYWRRQKIAFDGNRYVYNMQNNDPANIVEHWAQSVYAMHYLLDNKKTNVYFVSDYIGEQFLKHAAENINNTSRDDVVLYNPRKGSRFTRRIIRSSKSIQWVPLEGLARPEIVKLFLRSKVYIDFGQHPGKDRIPREAAACGVCVITSLDGSANYFHDVPILSCYKYSKSTRQIPAIISQLNRIIGDYEEHRKHFDFYRSYITTEQAKFTADVKARMCCLLGATPAKDQEVFELDV